MAGEQQEKNYNLKGERKVISQQQFFKAIALEKYSSVEEIEFSKLGIYRTTKQRVLDSLTTKYTLDYRTDEFDEKITVFENVEVEPTKKLMLNFNSNILCRTSILFYNSKIPLIKLNDATLAPSNKQKQRIWRCNIYITNSECLGIDVRDSFVGDITINDNTVFGGLVLQDSSVGVIWLRNSECFGMIKINNGNATSFTIDRCTINRDIQFKKSNLQFISIDKSDIQNLTINTSNSESISFYNCNSKDLIIDKSIVDKGIDIQNSNVGKINAINSSEIKKIYIFHSEVGDILLQEVKILFFKSKYLKNSIKIEKSEISQFNLDECAVDNLSITTGCKMEFYFTNGSINYLNFKNTVIGKETVVIFNNVNLSKCELNGFAMLGSLYYKDVKAITKSQNTSTNSIVPTFRIAQASLGKTEFTECDLAGFNFEYNNSKITEVFISGGTVPDNVVVYDEKNKLIKVEKLNQEKSFFDQLKKVFEGQGDIVRGTKYHALASNIQMKILWKQKNIAEWVVYLFNWASNKHGESWFRGLCFITVIAAVFFWGYNSALTPDKYTFAGWENIFQLENWRFLADYVKFIDITHKFNFMVDEPNPRAIVVDFVGRIFVVYGIYQLISAFRKHGKKG